MGAGETVARGEEASLQYQYRQLERFRCTLKMNEQGLTRNKTPTEPKVTEVGTQDCVRMLKPGTTAGAQC